MNINHCVKRAVSLKLLKRYSSIKVKTYVVHNMLNLLRWPKPIYMRVGYLSVFGFRNN